MSIVNLVDGASMAVKTTSEVIPEIAAKVVEKSVPEITEKVASAVDTTVETVVDAIKPPDVKPVNGVPGWVWLLLLGAVLGAILYYVNKKRFSE